ncbi:hypothetical protein IFM89_012948 [Coptis chinensis]|uniref:4-coumarate--CoA ligase n=1 Tax=Coptis chinensis TaxID=261450 RepID=A0A835IYP4_9MAGN|nr:hypothetical protein IFM89_012948 [Coptis chinensis]
MANEKSGEENNLCCISHLFYKTASLNPNNISVIHASAGAQICRQFRPHDINNNNLDNILLDYNSYRESHSNPYLKGDEFFTYSDVLSSVQSLSYRISHVIDNPDDPPYLIRPPQDCIVNDECVEEIGGPRIIGIYMVPSVEYIVALLSVLRCGEAFLPLDPSWPKQRILSIISSSKVALIVKSKSCFTATEDFQLEESDWLVEQSSCPVLEMSMKENREKVFGCSELVWPCQSMRKRKFCYLMYTSGSTGKPKGVCGTEIGLLNRYLWMQELFPLHVEEILLFKTSISFIDHLQEFLSGILSSVPLVIPPFEEFRINPFYIAEFLKAYRISRLMIVPSVMRAILPAMQSPHNIRVQSFFKVLVFSGEVLPISLCHVLHKLLPKISILNLYGSTEVSGDCTYFDCKRLPTVLETDVLSSVPIGTPISNCDIILFGEPNEPDEGEIYVGGLCTSMEYFLDPAATTMDYLKLSQVSELRNSRPFLDKENQLYFRTGDFARRLHTGDLVFLGRKDRTLKVNGQRVALEEIENNLREHPDVVDVAVISHESQSKCACLVAYVVLKGNEKIQMLDSHFRNWLVKRLPPAMIPNCYLAIKSLPLTSTGKLDYAFLSDSAFLLKQVKSNSDISRGGYSLLQAIKEAFSDALMVGEIKNDDDFFEMGGNSLSAAQVSYKLGVNMKLLYIYSSPYKLLNAILDHELEHTFQLGSKFDWDVDLEAQNGNKLVRSSLGIHSGSIDESPVSKCLKVEKNTYPSSSITPLREEVPWVSRLNLLTSCSFSRCNKVFYEGKYDGNDVCQACWSAQYPRNRKGSLHELWKVHSKSCIDASPLVVSKDGDIYLFIGSHSQIFLCIDAASGLVQWEVKLEGRIECSAAIVDDFSQVVVGCYKGKIYFLDFMTGNISWAFNTLGQVTTSCGQAEKADLCHHQSTTPWHPEDPQDPIFQPRLNPNSQNRGLPMQEATRGVRLPPQGCEIPRVNQVRGRGRGYQRLVQRWVDGDRNFWEQPIIRNARQENRGRSPSPPSSPSTDRSGRRADREPNRQIGDFERCGSYDHNLYALDYKNHCCVCHISCGGSIYGSPSISVVHNMLYVASTMGRVTAILIETSPFQSVWMHELGAPVFGSLISSANGNVVCCSVDGHVTVLSKSGSVVWKAITGGPIFAGACLTDAVPSQETGDMMWEYNIGDPITSSAYVDENMQLISDPSYSSDRLACVCSSSGSVYVLQVSLSALREKNHPAKDTVLPAVQEFAKVDLPGDIFSSPVMIGGRIFVGCRDEYVHCLEVKFDI